MPIAVMVLGTSLGEASLLASGCDGRGGTTTGAAVLRILTGLCGTGALIALLFLSKPQSALTSENDVLQVRHVDIEAVLFVFAGSHTHE